MLDCPVKHPSNHVSVTVTRGHRTNRRLITYSVLLVLARGHYLSRSANAVSAGNCKFSLPPLIWRPRSGWLLSNLWKSLWFLKLQSSRQLMVKFGDPSLHHFWLIHPCDGQTDGFAIAKMRNSSSCCCVIMIYMDMLTIQNIHVHKNT